MVKNKFISKLGLLRKKYKFLVFYAITMALYFVSFVGLGIYSDNLPAQLQSECSEDPQRSQFHLTFQAANRTLCQ
jgi:hypothetical protein